MRTDAAAGMRQSITADVPDIEGNPVTCIEIFNRRCSSGCLNRLNGASVSLCGELFGTVTNGDFIHEFPQRCARDVDRLPREVELDLAVACPYLSSLLTAYATSW
jgi:hypothetical protein